MDSRAATIRLAVGGVTISFSPILVTLADVGPTISAFYRMAIGGVVLVVIAWIRGTRHLPRPSHLVAGGVTGSLLALDLALWHRAVGLVGPGLATILGNLQVFFFAAFGVVFLKERPGRRVWIAIPLAVVGLYLIFGVGGALASPSYRLGVVFGLLTAVSYAAYLIALRRTRIRFKGESPVATVALFTVTAALLLGVSGLVEAESFAVPDRTTLAVLITLGLLPQVFGWLLISEALPYVETSRAGLMLLLQPSLAFVWDVLFFGRETGAIEYVGVTLALAGIYFGMTRPSGAGPDRQARRR